MLSFDELRSILNYDPETGLWSWRNPKAINKAPIAQSAGTISVHGYRIITYRGRKYRSARLAWLYMTGNWPSEEIDHENRDTTDDRWINLREASRSQNALNRDVQGNNSSGLRGIHFDCERGKWFVQVKVKGINHFIGRYDEVDEAVVARNAAVAELHGAFAQPVQENRT